MQDNTNAGNTTMGVGYTDKKDTIATEGPGFMWNKAGPAALTGSLSCKKS